LDQEFVPVATGRTAGRVKKLSKLGPESHFFYRVYFSKHNKESLVTLREEWDLDTFLEHREQIEIIEAYENEFTRSQIQKMKDEAKRK
jgi:hypothetical protein